MEADSLTDPALECVGDWLDNQPLVEDTMPPPPPKAIAPEKTFNSNGVPIKSTPLAPVFKNPVAPKSNQASSSSSSSSSSNPPAPAQPTKNLYPGLTPKVQIAPAPKEKEKPHPEPPTRYQPLPMAPVVTPLDVVEAEPEPQSQGVEEEETKPSQPDGSKSEEETKKEEPPKAGMVLYTREIVKKLMEDSLLVAPMSKQGVKEANDFAERVVRYVKANASKESVEYNMDHWYNQHLKPLVPDDPNDKRKLKMLMSFINRICISILICSEERGFRAAKSGPTSPFLQLSKYNMDLLRVISHQVLSFLSRNKIQSEVPSLNNKPPKSKKKKSENAKSMDNKLWVFLEEDAFNDEDCLVKIRDIYVEFLNVMSTIRPVCVITKDTVMIEGVDDAIACFMFILYRAIKNTEVQKVRMEDAEYKSVSGFVIHHVPGAQKKSKKRKDEEEEEEDDETPNAKKSATNGRKRKATKDDEDEDEAEASDDSFVSKDDPEPESEPEPEPEPKKKKRLNKLRKARQSRSKSPAPKKGKSAKSRSKSPEPEPEEDEKVEAEAEEEEKYESMPEDEKFFKRPNGSHLVYPTDSYMDHDEDLFHYVRRIEDFDFAGLECLKPYLAEINELADEISINLELIRPHFKKETMEKFSMPSAMRTTLEKMRWLKEKFDKGKSKEYFAKELVNWNDLLEMILVMTNGLRDTQRNMDELVLKSASELKRVIQMADSFKLMDKILADKNEEMEQIEVQREELKGDRDVAQALSERFMEEKNAADKAKEEAEAKLEEFKKKNEELELALKKQKKELEELKKHGGEPKSKPKPEEPVKKPVVPTPAPVEKKKAQSMAEIMKEKAKKK